jgi:acyl-coenzyme A thioesterase PaaI-like protein
MATTSTATERTAALGEIHVARGGIAFTTHPKRSSSGGQGGIRGGAVAQRGDTVWAVAASSSASPSHQRAHHQVASLWRCKLGSR